MCIRDRYLSACDKVAKAAQKHINWNDSVGCAYMPGDGLCIEIEVSGNVTKENIARLTGLGVDYVSSGALTHSAPHKKK